MTKNQLAAAIVATRRIPAYSPSGAEVAGKYQRRLERMKRPELLAEYDAAHRVSGDTEALAELATEALDEAGLNGEVYICDDTVRVFFPGSRETGFDAGSALFQRLGFIFSTWSDTLALQGI